MRVLLMQHRLLRIIIYIYCIMSVAFPLQHLERMTNDEKRQIKQTVADSINQGVFDVNGFRRANPNSIPFFKDDHHPLDFNELIMFTDDAISFKEANPYVDVQVQNIPPWALLSANSRWRYAGGRRRYKRSKRARLNNKQSKRKQSKRKQSKRKQSKRKQRR